MKESAYERMKGLGGGDPERKGKRTRKIKKVGLEKRGNQEQ